MPEKKKRLRDPKLLAGTRALPCTACGAKSDAAHVKSRGAGGDDLPQNLLPLCRRHHSEQHQLGFVRFSRKYPAVLLRLRTSGWEIETIFGQEKLVRKDPQE